MYPINNPYMANPLMRFGNLSRGTPFMGGMGYGQPMPMPAQPIQAAPVGGMPPAMGGPAMPVNPIARAPMAVPPQQNRMRFPVERAPMSFPTGSVNSLRGFGTTR